MGFGVDEYVHFELNTSITINTAERQPVNLAIVQAT
jgi:hypothetical protein